MSGNGVRLHMFECGTLKCHVENIKMNQGLGEEYEIPVPWFLIEHPRGLVVIDGGNAAECAANARGHWGDICDVYWPEMKPEQACVPAMESAGFNPTDVRYVLQSHLHLDHTGALGAIDFFPNAEVIATRAEFEYGHAPDWFAAGGYIQKDFVKPGIQWALLEESEDGYDVFGDGTIRCWRTPGHAPGHQSFEVTLPNTGTMLLTVLKGHVIWTESTPAGSETPNPGTLKDVLVAFWGWKSVLEAMHSHHCVPARKLCVFW